jgi:hypothetical protein
VVRTDHRWTSSFSIALKKAVLVGYSTENVFSVHKRLLFILSTCVEGRDLVNM